MLIELENGIMKNELIYVFDLEAHDKKTLKNLSLNDDQRDDESRAFAFIFGNMMSAPMYIGGGAGLINWIAYSASPVQFIASSSLLTIGGGLCWMSNKFGMRQSRHERALQRATRKNSIMISTRGLESANKWYSLNALAKSGRYAYVQDHLFGNDRVKNSRDIKRYLGELQSSPEREVFRRIKPHLDAYFAMTAQHDIALRDLGPSASPDKRHQRESEVDQCAEDLLKRAQEVVEEYEASKKAGETIVEQQKRIVADTELDQLPDITFHSGYLIR